VRHVHVDTIDAEPLEARVELAEDARRSESAILALVHRVVDLGREERTSLGTARREPPSDHRLAAAASVRVRGVEDRDPGCDRRVHQLERGFLRLALAEQLGRGSDPAEVAAAEEEARDGEAATAEGACLHRETIIPGRWSKRS